MRILLISLLFLSSFSAKILAQALSWTPLYPNVLDTITIIYDASQGNAALAGVSEVYMHTGVLVKGSVYSGDWKYRPAQWGKPDSIVLMESLGNNLHKARFPIRQFYGIFSGDIATHLGYVFRNADGSLAGKNADDSDFFIRIYNPGEWVNFTKPVEFPLNPQSGNNIPIQITAKETAMINLYHNDNLVSQSYDTVLNYTLTAGNTGKHWIWYSAQKAGQTVTDSMYYIVQAPQVFQDPPLGTQNGINYINDSTVILQLFAPYKNFAYVIGDFSNWEADPTYKMNKTNDHTTYWLEITGLEKQKEYGFQYFVDFQINIACPYADKVLDRWNDPGIHQIIYPNLKPYPVGKTSELVAVLQTGQEPYQWQITDFQKPDRRDLVIYEMLVRDWHLWHNYKTVMDSIEYLKTLGINAIELLPVMEFDGNDSWGYMPNSFFAVDKWYGSRRMLKEFIDECHKHGIAVILDIVLNHASGQNTLARLYKNIETGKTTAENPWFNERIPHPFGYHHDFDHASFHTQYFVDRVLDYWLREFNADGYRLDLSKGFTNNVTVGYDDEGDIIWSDVGAWGAYDADRVYFIKRMADVVWANHPGAYMILEHLAGFEEEKVLSDYGFMLWCGMAANVQYRQAAMGYPDNWDFKWGIDYQNYQGGNLGQHNLVGYKESHDEERIVYECLAYGNEHYEPGDTTPAYSIKNLKTALERMELVSAFFFTIPGPKMIWQFGERGYDYSINWPSMTDESRTSMKPPKWDYMRNWHRYKLYKTYAALIKLKIEYPIFRTSNYELHTANYDKRIRLWDDGYVNADFSVVVVGNFDVVEKPVWPEFSHAATWYDYFSGDSLIIDGSQTQGNGFTLSFKPGEYRLYTDKKLPEPDMTIPIDTSSGSGIVKVAESFRLNTLVYPNPSSSEVNIAFDGVHNNATVLICNAFGVPVREFLISTQKAQRNTLVWDGSSQSGRPCAAGNYFYTITSGSYYDFGWITLVK